MSEFKPTYVSCRGGHGYYATLNVPRECQALLKRSKFRKTLRTKDHAEAMLRAAPLLSKWRRWIAEARAQIPRPLHGPPLTQEELDEFKPDWD